MQSVSRMSIEKCIAFPRIDETRDKYDVIDLFKMLSNKHFLRYWLKSILRNETNIIETDFNGKDDINLFENLTTIFLVYGFASFENGSKGFTRERERAAAKTYISPCCNSMVRKLRSKSKSSVSLIFVYFVSLFLYCAWKKCTWFHARCTSISSWKHDQCELAKTAVL